jgi:hypothetical protein
VGTQALIFSNSPNRELEKNHLAGEIPICTNFSGIPINQGLSASQTVQNIAKTL